MVAELEQYEVWVFRAGRWQMIAAFFDLDLASAVASKRNSRVKIVHALYEEGRLKDTEVIAEIGNIRSA